MRPSSLRVCLLGSSVALGVFAADAVAQQPPPAPSVPVAPSSQPPWVMLPVPAGTPEPPPPPPADPAALPAPETAPPAAHPPPPGYGGYPPSAYPSYGGYPPDYYGPPPPVYVPPEHRRGWHVHQGLYFRLGFGVAMHRSKIAYPIGLESSADRLSGTGIAIDAAIGGAVIPGLIIAADIGGHDVSNPSRSQRNDSYSPAGVSYSRLGVMADWYINPRRGFHVQSGIAFASLTLPDSTRNLRTLQTASYPDALSGVGGNIGVGWEGWVGADWSIGGLLRFDWASLRQSVDNGGVARASVTTPSLLFTMTFN